MNTPYLGQETGTAPASTPTWMLLNHHIQHVVSPAQHDRQEAETCEGPSMPTANITICLTLYTNQ